MPEIPRFPAFDLVSKLNKELQFSLNAGQADPLVGTGASLQTLLTTQQVSQNPDGTWNEVIADGDFPIKDQNQTISNVDNDQSSLISSYEQLATVYDTEMLNYNDQINAKKSQIVSIVNTAIGAGCSFRIPSITVPGADNINGVACGIGSTIKEDNLSVKIYTNISNYSSDSPFNPSTTSTLSTVNLGKGYQDVVSNNEGTVLTSTYRVIPDDTASHALMVGLTLAQQTTCAGYGSSVLSIATEIATLRGQRDQYLQQVNDLKTLKTDEEFAKWGVNQTGAGLTDYNSSLQNAITSISQYVDNIVIDGLIVHYDAAGTYGIETTVETDTGINAVTKWNNLTGDGLYASPQTSLYSISLDNGDGPSVVLNNTTTTTNQYLTIPDSYISGSGEIGVGNTSYSIEVWAKVTKDSTLGISSTTNGASIVGINSVNGYGLQVYKPSGIRVSFGERGAGSLVNTTNLSLNTWYHVVGVNEAGVGSKVYINGVLDGSGSAINIVSSASNLQFGYAPNKISQYFGGKISIVRIYRKSLSATEVTQNFNAQKTRYGY